jgi:hypothetical protein
VDVDHSLAVGAAVFYVLTGVNTERNQTAWPAPREGGRERQREREGERERDRERETERNRERDREKQRDRERQRERERETERERGDSVCISICTVYVCL